MNSTPTGIHPAPTIFTQAQIEADNILQFFHYAHLPETLQATSRPFCLLAEELVNTLPRCAERSVALRKLLEAKDAAVRANVGMPANSGLPNHALNAGLRKEETFMDRLITERDELGQKLAKLQEFLNGPKPAGVTDKQIDMLYKQAHAMDGYFQILCDRIVDLQRLEGNPCTQDGATEMRKSDNPALKEHPSPKFAHPDDIEDATVEPVEIGNHDIDRDGPIPFNG